MSKKSARLVLFDALLAWLAACAAIVMFLPPLDQATLASWPRSWAAGTVIALAMPLHWLFLGVAASRMGRSVGAWVGLSVLLFPVGSAAALILLAGSLAQPGRRPAEVR
jgi:hypothetical protein